MGMEIVDKLILQYEADVTGVLNSYKILNKELDKIEEGLKRNTSLAKKFASTVANISTKALAKFDPTKTFRDIGTAMERMPVPDMSKAFSRSDAVADSLARRGLGKETYTFMSDAVQRAADSSRVPILSRTEAIADAMRKRGEFVSPIKEFGLATDLAKQKMLSFNEVVKKIANNINKKLNKVLSKAKQKMHEFSSSMLQIGLSALFTGMAIKRAADQFLKGTMTAFTTARGEGDAFVNQLLGVQASFEFLKFAIFDAFAQTDLFRYVIEFLINLNNGLAQFIVKRPALAKLIFMFAGFASVLGGVLMVLGQAGLAFLGLEKAYLLIKGLKMAKMFTAMKFSLNGFLLAALKTVAVVALFLAVAMVITIIITIWDELVQAFKIRIKQISLWISGLADLFKTTWDIALLYVEMFALGAKKVIIDSFSSAINWVSDKIDWFIKKLPEGAQVALGFKPIDFQGFDTEGIDAQIKAISDKIPTMASEWFLRDWSRGVEGQNLAAQLQMNKAEADTKVQDMFSDIKSFFTGSGEAGSPSAAEMGKTEVNINAGTVISDREELLKLFEDSIRLGKERDYGAPLGG